jgi:hypothetical protein
MWTAAGLRNKAAPCHNTATMKNGASSKRRFFKLLSAGNSAYRAHIQLCACLLDHLFLGHARSQFDQF